ncbi:MAG: hypothetical protein J6Y28_03840 [Acholeplasmatales bacterium]|nr:hypothetical protein [Acholeplasmatales bacterium]
MKKLRIVILSLSVFSLFCSAFFNLGYIIHDKTENMNNTLINSIKIPFGSNFFLFLVMFIIVLVWYLYHLKNRAESITNGIMLLLFLAYIVIGLIGLKELIDLTKTEGVRDSVWFNYSLAILIAPGMWNIINFIPVLLHFIASVQTGGYDNVGEPDNPFGFMFTIIGLCYLITLITIGLAMHNDLFIGVFALYENGLITSLIMLVFILCAGLRFNSAILDAFNILMQFIFVISWIVIPLYNRDYLTVQKYFCIYHIVFVIPMFILSIFIFKHYIEIDRFYKSRTGVFLK